MYNLHKELYEFYDRYVRLSEDDKTKLRGYRDTNVDRLENGLVNLGHNTPLCTLGQGSYAMHTMVQHPDNDYDIDVAVIFADTDLPDNPLDARKRVLAGIKAGGDSSKFKQPPEARTNAVTVWYAAGYHIDLAVYRRRVDSWGNEVTEHAGVNWTPRDPSEITNWFNDEVARQSPSSENGATVNPKQMRRIVRLIKMFAKSRDSWNLAGGLLISALVSERYQPDYYRDDVALYNTMKSIRSRIQSYTEIRNPVDVSLVLTDTTEHVNEVVRLGEKLSDAICWLEPLLRHDCEEVDAYKAWNKVFKHIYWSEMIEGIEMQKAAKFVSAPGFLHLDKPVERSAPSPQHRFYGD